MIDLKLHKEIREKNARRCKERSIILPTFAEMKNPGRIPVSIRDTLKELGLWEVDPRNLFRITWKNEPTEQGGTFGPVNYIEIPRELTGIKARLFALVGKWFPTGAHKVGATYGCLAPTLVSGSFDATRQKAVWPSTGNYCRGGAYNSALLACDSVAILPEEMSRERFDWLKNVAGEVIATPGCESNVKEIFDKCHELEAERGDGVVIFNQFSEFGNYLWHYEITGSAIEEVLQSQGIAAEDYAGFVSSTGSAGTIAAGDYLKQAYPESKIVAAEALQCPTLLRNGFGGHRIEGIGDKHVPWIHNVRNTDMVIAVDDNDCMDLFRLFNEAKGMDFLDRRGIDEQFLSRLELFGLSGIGNLLASIKFAKYYELDEDQVVFTVLTDSAELYSSRIREMHEQRGSFTDADSAAAYHGSMLKQGLDSVAELGYYERLRIHNLKYYTWIEQQGKTIDQLQAQWYDRNWWKRIQAMVPEIDTMIEEFNELTGLK
ncbi:MAG: pyridoxal-phosphate dependent enzyme [Spirochaetales bacterium]|nr:pyridoxal-phosphate dependent enzyme [Spirochaetales bacterium]MCF7938467.1 pyridoxal-phosphate dependent enzyme [Spirochaetales bacterium]